MFEHASKASGTQGIPLLKNNLSWPVGFSFGLQPYHCHLIKVFAFISY